LWVARVKKAGMRESPESTQPLRHDWAHSRGDESRALPFLPFV
jgi:hypothetical protein